MRLKDHLIFQVHFSSFHLYVKITQPYLHVSKLTFNPHHQGIFNDPDCYRNGVDHNLVLVGYNLVNQPPFWILRNAWGPRWGENGYMRMEIQSGDGVCGIKTMPGYYPVFSKRMASNLWFWLIFPSFTSCTNMK